MQALSSAVRKHTLSVAEFTLEACFHCCHRTCHTAVIRHEHCNPHAETSSPIPLQLTAMRSELARAQSTSCLQRINWSRPVSNYNSNFSPTGLCTFAQRLLLLYVRSGVRLQHGPHIRTVIIIRDGIRCESNLSGSQRLVARFIGVLVICYIICRSVKPTEKYIAADGAPGSVIPK